MKRTVDKASKTRKMQSGTAWKMNGYCINGTVGIIISNIKKKNVKHDTSIKLMIIFWPNVASFMSSKPLETTRNTHLCKIKTMWIAHSPWGSNVVDIPWSLICQLIKKQRNMDHPPSLRRFLANRWKIRFLSYHLKCPRSILVVPLSNFLT